MLPETAVKERKRFECQEQGSCLLQAQLIQADTRTFENMLQFYFILFCFIFQGNPLQLQMSVFILLEILIWLLHVAVPCKQTNHAGNTSPD